MTAGGRVNSGWLVFRQKTKTYEIPVDLTVLENDRGHLDVSVNMTITKQHLADCMATENKTMFRAEKSAVIPESPIDKTGMKNDCPACEEPWKQLVHSCVV